jgi:hypothetical protein
MDQVHTRSLHTVCNFHNDASQNQEISQESTTRWPPLPSTYPQLMTARGVREKTKWQYFSATPTTQQLTLSTNISYFHSEGCQFKPRPGDWQSRLGTSEILLTASRPGQHHNIFIWYFGNLSNTWSSSTHCLLLGHEHSKQYHISDRSILYNTIYH